MFTFRSNSPWSSRVSTLGLYTVVSRGGCSRASSCCLTSVSVAMIDLLVRPLLAKRLICDGKKRITLLLRDLDLARLGTLGLGQLQQQHAVGERRLDPFGIDVERHSQHAIEGAKTALLPMIGHALARPLAALPANRQIAAHHGNIQVVILKARPSRFDVRYVSISPHIEGRNRRRRAARSRL